MLHRECHWLNKAEQAAGAVCSAGRWRGEEEQGACIIGPVADVGILSRVTGWPCRLADLAGVIAKDESFTRGAELEVNVEFVRR